MPPVSLWVVEGIDEVFVGLQVIENLRVLRDEVIDLFGLGFESIQLRHQIFLYFEFVLDCRLRLLRLLLDALDKLMHELHIILEIQFPRLERFLLILDGVLQFGSLLLFDIDIHLGEVDLLLLLQELVHGFLLLCVRP